MAGHTRFLCRIWQSADSNLARLLVAVGAGRWAAGPGSPSGRFSDMPRQGISGPLTTQLLLLLVAATLIPLALMLDRIRTDALDAEQRAGTRAGWVARRSALRITNASQVATSTVDALAHTGELWNGSDAERERGLSGLDSSNTALEGLV